MSNAEADVVTKLSSQSVRDTTAKLTSMISAKGMKLFGVIDQADEARQVGLTLRETVLVIFGSPKAGTPVMDASPLSALDLPLKVLIWADGDQTKVCYYAPTAVAASHHLTADLAANLSGINALTDALVALYALLPIKGGNDEHYRRGRRRLEEPGPDRDDLRGRDDVH
jgi:uncharacterized protein (DUF302 family)